MAGARAAVGPVCGDDEVGIGECALILHFMLECLLDAELTGALLQQVEQALAAYAAEAMSAAHEAPAVDVNRDVIPVVEARGDRPVGLGVGGAEVLHGPVGEHHPPAERIIRAVALVDFDACGRPRLAQQDACVQSGDRKSTRLNSSHDQISNAAFCLKKKKKTKRSPHTTTSPSIRSTFSCLVLLTK